MPGFTKREMFLGVAGLGAGLVAGGVIFKPTGTSDPWGPGHGNPEGDNFNPRSLCIVYLQFDEILAPPPNPSVPVPVFKVRHVWFAPSGGNAAADLTKAINEFKKIIGTPSTPGVWPPSGPGVNRYGEGFNNYNFGSRSRIYFYVDDQPHVSFDEENLIQFTEFAADRLPDGSRRRMKRNRAFSNALVIETTGQQLPGKVLYMENHFKRFRFENAEWLGAEDIPNPPGGPSPNPANPKQPFLEYSMNIHLRMKMSNGSTVPLVIDPNTGNGGGWEP